MNPGVKLLFKYIKAQPYGGKHTNWFLDSPYIWRAWYHEIRRKP